MVALTFVSSSGKGLGFGFEQHPNKTARAGLSPFPRKWPFGSLGLQLVSYKMKRDIFQDQGDCVLIVFVF